MCAALSKGNLADAVPEVWLLGRMGRSRSGIDVRWMPEAAVVARAKRDRSRTTRRLGGPKPQHVVDDSYVCPSVGTSLDLGHQLGTKAVSPACDLEQDSSYRSKLGSNRLGRAVRLRPGTFFGDRAAGG